MPTLTARLLLSSTMEPLAVPNLALASGTAMSTSEGELAALCLCARKLIPLKLTIDMLNNLPHPTPPVAIYENNRAVLDTLRRRLVNGRLRHVRVALSFVIQAIADNVLTVEWIETSQQLADFFTKSLPRDPFKALIDKLTT